MKKTLICALFAAVSLAITAACHQSGYLKFIDGKLLDSRFSLRETYFRSPESLSKDVVLLMVDDASIEALKDVLGRWPWPRKIWGEVVDELRRRGAKRIVFDILFTEKQENLSGLGPNDLALVQATAAGTDIVHSMQLVKDTEDDVNKTLLNRKIPQDVIDRFSFSNIRLENSPITESNNNFYLPFSELLELTSRLGVVEFSADPDGIYRRTPLIRLYQDHWFPTSPLATLYENKAPLKLSARNLSIDGTSVPLDENQNYLVNLHKRFPTYSISGLLATMQSETKGEKSSAFFRGDEFQGKVVMIGVSAVGGGDIKTTALGANTPGVILFASIIDNLLQKDFLTPVGILIPAVACFAISFLIVAGILFFTSFLAQIASCLAIFTGAALTGFLTFTHFNYVLPLGFIIVNLLLSATLGYLYYAFTEGKEKRKVRKMLSQYVSPIVLREVMDKREGVSAEVGTKENMTILFSDVRGFTSLSERLNPEQVVQMLNHYLNHMVDAVFEFRGTLDKFVGDAVMAFWGAPLKSDDHALQATRAALKMIEQLKVVNEEFKLKKWPQIEVGIGLHTGDVILGNIGSDKKLDYTVIGDNVNLSSRVEGLTKAYHAQLLVTESTFERIKDTVPCRILDRVCVKGKSKPIAIYAPLLKGEGKDLAKIYGDAFHAYTENSFTLAKELYEKIAEMDPGSASAEYCNMMVERCEEYLLNPPPADWGGAYVMTSK
jgi:adenylate cyclase